MVRCSFLSALVYIHFCSVSIGALSLCLRRRGLIPLKEMKVLQWWTYSITSRYARSPSYSSPPPVVLSFLKSWLGLDWFGYFLGWSVWVVSKVFGDYGFWGTSVHVRAATSVGLVSFFFFLRWFLNGVGSTMVLRFLGVWSGSGVKRVRGSVRVVRWVEYCRSCMGAQNSLPFYKYKAISRPSMCRNTVSSWDFLAILFYCFIRWALWRVWLGGQRDEMGDGLVCVFELGRWRWVVGEGVAQVDDERWRKVVEMKMMCDDDAGW